MSIHDWEIEGGDGAIATGALPARRASPVAKSGEQATLGRYVINRDELSEESLHYQEYSSGRVSVSVRLSAIAMSPARSARDYSTMKKSRSPSTNALSSTRWTRFLSSRTKTRNANSGGLTSSAMSFGTLCQMLQRNSTRFAPLPTGPRRRKPVIQPSKP